MAYCSDPLHCPDDLCATASTWTLCGADVDMLREMEEEEDAMLAEDFFAWSLDQDGQ